MMIDEDISDWTTHLVDPTSMPTLCATKGVFCSLVTPKIHVTSNIQILIKSIKYKLITKSITQIEANFRDDFFKPN